MRTLRCSDMENMLDFDLSSCVYAHYDRDLMSLILEKGHSRIPVYYEQPTNIIGLILVLNNFFLCNTVVLCVLGCIH